MKSYYKGFIIWLSGCIFLLIGIYLTINYFNYFDTNNMMCSCLGLLYLISIFSILIGSFIAINHSWIIKNKFVKYFVRLILFPFACITCIILQGLLHRGENRLFTYDKSNYEYQSHKNAKYEMEIKQFLVIGGIVGIFLGCIVAAFLPNQIWYYGAFAPFFGVLMILAAKYFPLD